MREILNYPLIDSLGMSITVMDLLKVIITLMLAWLLAEIARKILHKRAEEKTRSNAGRYFAFAQLIKYLIYTLCIVIILDLMGVNMTMFKAGSAALLVGLGFGLQHTFNDFVSGIIILFEGTLQVGHIVEIQTVVGRVKHIGLRTSRIETRDGVTIIVPNSKLVSDNVVNWSHQQIDLTRFVIRLPVGVESDVKKVKEILLAVAQLHKDVVKSPAPKVRLYDFNESGYVFDLLFWTSNMFFVETVKSDLRFMIVEEFKKNNIRIAFPKRDVQVKNVE
ncbi:MAG TPA: mechanosensitive ion channel domain-containing protein [Bacteroidia bacterium]|nr:mechanosensitive ion channel domain-containing protein [Bacteroidia bacterium]